MKLELFGTKLLVQNDFPYVAVRFFILLPSVSVLGVSAASPSEWHQWHRKRETHEKPVFGFTGGRRFRHLLHVVETLDQCRAPCPVQSRCDVSGREQGKSNSNATVL